MRLLNLERVSVRTGGCAPIGRGRPAGWWRLGAGCLLLAVLLLGGCTDKVSPPVGLTDAGNGVDTGRDTDPPRDTGTDEIVQQRVPVLLPATHYGTAGGGGVVLQPHGIGAVVRGTSSGGGLRLQAVGAEP